MTAFAGQPEAEARGIRFMEPDETRICNPAVRGEIAGALHCSEDAVVEPRLALGASGRTCGRRQGSGTASMRGRGRGGRASFAGGRGGNPVGG